jgi:energy-coupling factor transport system ATP-binding protein
MSSPPAGIEARGWGWRHAGRRAWALRGLDLRIEAGERVLLLGPSGAGKSTLLAALAGLLDRDAGESEGTLLVDGARPSEARERIGILFQDPEAQLVMARAGDDVAFGLENRCVPTDAIWSRVTAALDAVGFRYELAHPTNALSGGEKQRLALAGTLALRPGLLLLDEPTANLDPQGAALIRDVLGRVLDRIGATMLLVEHRVDAALSLVDRVVVLQPGGGVMADGPPARVFAAHGDALAAAGVWVPDRPIRPPPRRNRPPSETLLLAEQVGFRYPAALRMALEGIDASIRSGEALAIVGPNGSGKSTLALLFAGLLRPVAGAVMAGEALARGHGHEPIWRWPARNLVSRIGTVFQEPEHQFLAASVVDELRLGPLRAGASHAEATRRARELMERLHLSHLAEANPFTLSGGEKRRLSVATALATAPPALILDEPTFGQDRRTAGELLELLGALRDTGRGVCFVSHDRPFVSALADRRLSLHDGRTGSA